MNPKTIQIHFQTIRQAKKFIRHCLNEGLVYADLEGELHEGVIDVSWLTNPLHFNIQMANKSGFAANIIIDNLLVKPHNSSELSDYGI